MTSSPKNASRASRTTGTTGPMPATSGVPTAQPISPPDPGRPALGVGGVADHLRDAEHRRDQADPADHQPAPRLGPWPAAQQPEGGEEQHDRQHHDQRADDPADAVGQGYAHRADAVAPGGGAQDDGQAEHGQAHAVAAVLGRERLGLLRSGDGPGQAAGPAGEQPPGAAGGAPQVEAGVLLARGWAAVAGPLGGRPLLARSGRTRAVPVGRRPRVDVERAGMRRTVIRVEAAERAGRASCPAPASHLITSQP